MEKITKEIMEAFDRRMERIEELKKEAWDTLRKCRKAREELIKEIKRADEEWRRLTKKMKERRKR